MIEKFTQICPTLSSNLSNLINQKKLNFGGIAISITTQNAHLLMGQHFISYFRLYLHLGKLKETQFRKLCDRVSPLSLFSKAPAFVPPAARKALPTSLRQLWGWFCANCKLSRSQTRAAFCQVAENECNRSVYGSVVLFSS